MEPIVVFFIAIAVFVVILAIRGIIIVNHAQEMIIERLGSYNRTLTGGVNIIWPFLEKPRKILWRFPYTQVAGAAPQYLQKEVERIDLRETVYDFPRQNVITQDNVQIEINALLYFQITDSVKAVYEIFNLPEAIEKLTQTTLRNIIGELSLDQTLTSRDTINARLREVLDDATDKWGVKVNRVELQDIVPPADIRVAMEKQMRAERDRRAVILEAEGQKRSAILKAEGERESQIVEAEGIKQSEILRAEGDAFAIQRRAQAEAEAINAVAAAVRQGKSDPAQYLIATKYIETLNEMVQGQASKVVYVPYEASGVLSALGGIKELLTNAANNK